ncbi:MAG: sulfatase-like hydrolase/transferase [Ginsengibacter sp.]
MSTILQQMKRLRFVFTLLLKASAIDKKIALQIILLFFSFNIYAQPTKDTLVDQNIVYKTSQLNEIYLVWTMDNWKIPEKKYQPEGTYVKDGMAYTKMIGQKDSFNINLRLQKGMYIDFMLLGTMDSTGKIAEAWDTHWGQNYNVYISGDGKSKIIDDSKLAFVLAEKKQKIFHILEEGKLIFFIAIALFILSLILLALRRRKIYFPKFVLNNYLFGLLVSSFIIMMLVRLEMNDYFFNNQYLVFGVSLYDFIFLFFFSLFFFSVLYISKKYPFLQYFIKGLFILLIFGLVLFSLLNIEIVKQLGKPINYNWLYYSDFLKAADAKNALRSSFNPGLITNILLIILAIALLAYTLALLFYNKLHAVKRTAILICSFLILFLVTGYIQSKQNKFDRAKIGNPVYVLASSWINAESKPSLFTINISQKTKDDIALIHHQQPYEKLPGTDSIKNIVIFVLESTPANMVQVYDSTYQVTPNLNDWKKQAVIYSNIYAHLPNTVSSVFSITSSLYPMISYKAVINEHPDIVTPTLPQLLKEKGWNTSLFYSSDLTYSNIGEYVTNHGFQTAEDFKIINCGFDKFESNYAQLDGLDDRCIVSRYLNWKDKLKGENTFSVLWTNQTHYPYFSHDKIKYTDNAALNPYLNALKNVDESFNQLMQGLKNSSSLNNTLVVVVGDHGEAFGTHNQYSHASKIYEENMHVPCLIINPALFKGIENNRIGGLIDIAPTLMHLLNMPVPAEWQGSSLLSGKQKSHTFFVGPFSDFLFGSRFDNWKLIFNATSNEYELYDLRNDPKELINIANKYPDMVKREYNMLAGWVQYHTKRINQTINSNK